jgi:hypothetical protein
MVMGAGGSRTVDVTAYRNATLHVGGARVAFAELESVEPRSPPYAVRDGILGADALAKGRVVIDPAAREFLLTP